MTSRVTGWLVLGGQVILVALVSVMEDPTIGIVVGWIVTMLKTCIFLSKAHAKVHPPLCACAAAPPCSSSQHEHLDFARAGSYVSYSDAPSTRSRGRTSRAPHNTHTLARKRESTLVVSGALLPPL